jgi:hypothetical protein
VDEEEDDQGDGQQNQVQQPLEEFFHESALT